MRIEQRNVAMCVLLSFITCGIYGVYWAYKVGKEATSVANDDGTLESILMIFFMPVGLYLTEKKFADGCRMRNIPHEDRTVMYLLLSIFGLGIVSMAMLQGELNKLAPQSM